MHILSFCKINVKQFTKNSQYENVKITFSVSFYSSFFIHIFYFDTYFVLEKRIVMDFVYTFFIAFFMIFFSELGDKTQLLVLSFSNKSKVSNILLGIGIGTFFSHGLAILFGSHIGNFDNVFFNFYLKIFTYSTFLLLGILGFMPKKSSDESAGKVSFMQKICNLKINYVFLTAISIFIGEIGDKTFLASLGISLQYPSYKVSLILGCILGMILSNCIAIFFAKFLSNKFNQGFIEFLSNIIFIVFGLLGFVSLIIF